MAINGNGGGRFGNWLSSGLLGTIAWGVVLIIYCAFRAFGIEDPLLGQAFLLLTGAWVGNLTIAQSKKTAVQEKKTEQVVQEVRELREAVAAESHDGERGPAGDQGPLGDRGPRGDRGFRGDKGPNGDGGVR